MSEEVPIPPARTAPPKPLAPPQPVCHHCGAQGGIFALVAGYAGFDVRVDFHRALGLAAAIAGVPNGVPDEDYARLRANAR